MNQGDRQWDAWLGGELKPVAKRAFEARLACDRELRQRTQAAQHLSESLSRQFKAPEGLPAGIRAALGELGLQPQSNAAQTRVASWLALAAGFVLVLAKALGTAAPMPAPGELGGLEPGEQRLVAGSLALPLFDGAMQLSGGRVVPNLEGLLCTVAQFTEQASLAQCSTEELQRERAQWGGALGLNAAALGLLEGPIVAPEWPGSTVFASRSEGSLSLLIAGDDAWNTCCLEVRAPRNTDLRVHTWRVGGTLWYEVSPYAEPRLLSLLEGAP